MTLKMPTVVYVIDLTTKDGEHERIETMNELDYIEMVQTYMNDDYFTKIRVHEEHF